MIISVVVLSYKKFDNIFKNIDSIISQTYERIEIILSDDGSEDYPDKEIGEYINKKKNSNIVRYEVLANPKNVGTVKHLNNAVKHVTGELMVCLSQDDCFYDNKVLEKIVVKYKNSYFNVLTMTRLVCNELYEPICFLPHIFSRLYISSRLNSSSKQFRHIILNKSFDFFSGSCMCVNVAFLRNVGCYDENFILWEDGPFITNITSKGYEITQGYDIISTVYRLGGLSNAGGNSLIRTDINNYNERYRGKNLGTLTFWENRRLSYYYESLSKKDENLRLRYFDQFMCNCFYRCYSAISYLIDRLYISIHKNDFRF